MTYSSEKAISSPFSTVCKNSFPRESITEIVEDKKVLQTINAEMVASSSCSVNKKHFGLMSFLQIESKTIELTSEALKEGKTNTFPVKFFL